MTWCFTGRAEQLDRIGAVIAAGGPGPVIVTGEPGAGGSSLLRRAVGLVDGDRDVVLEADGGAPGGPYAPLAAHLPDELAKSPASGTTTLRVAEAIVDRAGGRRPVLVLDDAHLAHHAAVVAIREVHRRTGAVVLVATHTPEPGHRGPDAIDCLRYESGAQIIALGPLTGTETAALLGGLVGGRVHPATAAALHAATGGNPALLHDLVVRNDLSGDLVERDGLWRLDHMADAPLLLGAAGTRHLLDAVHESWRDLALDRLAELCALALRTGAGADIAHVWSGLLLLRGEARRGLDFLDGLDHDRSGHSRAPHLVLARAVLLALGLGRIADAEALLLDVVGSGGVLGERAAAHRAWLLAVTGATDRAEAVLRDLPVARDQEASVFARAATGAVALAGNRPAAAVPHLRRAIIGAEPLRADLPWLAPFTTGCLIDALLLAGRISEATQISGDFHGALGGCGWDVAVALSTLIGAHAPVPAATGGVRRG
ncbi:MAG: ATP-binding protein [Umezawaea sp.]